MGRDGWRKYLGELQSQYEGGRRGRRRGKWTWLTDVRNTFTMSVSLLRMPHCKKGPRQQHMKRFLSYQQVFESTLAVFHRSHLRAMVVMLIVWFMFSFG